MLKKEKTVFCSAVVAAAGSSSRMGGVNKLMEPLLGVPVFLRTIMALVDAPSVHEIVVAAKEADLLPLADLCKPFADAKPIRLVVGGATRTESVMAALRECDPRAKLVAVHDAARPLVTRSIIEETILLAKKTSAAAPAVPVKDTIKVQENGVVLSTPDRSTLCAVQTPQVFDRDLLAGALEAARSGGFVPTDDCSAVEALGKKVYLTEGSYENLKITTPEDLLIAEMLLEKRGGN